MKPEEDGIQALSRAVLSQARAEAKQILADAKARADAVRKRAEEQAALDREGILERARQEAEQIRSQAIAAAQLAARTLRLERREKLLDNVFEAVRQRLPAVQQWTDYPGMVRQLIQEAAVGLGADVIRIRADERAHASLTDDVLAGLSSQLSGQLQLGMPLENGTGVVVETADGRRQYDNTLEARLRRGEDALRAPVYRLLMGESL